MADEEKILIVLYRSEKKSQFWCGYWGGDEEAASEWKLLAKENPGLEEAGRFWAQVKTMYVQVPNGG